MKDSSTPKYPDFTIDSTKDTANKHSFSKPHHSAFSKYFWYLGGFGAARWAGVFYSTDRN